MFQTAWRALRAEMFGKHLLMDKVWIWEVGRMALILKWLPKS